MSNPPTVFRTSLNIPLSMITPPKPGDESVRISMEALNAQGALKAAWPNGITRTCISCDNFIDHVTNGPRCALAGKAPPARIIAFGCEQYSDDQDVPF
jgi:hypothetical protein